MYVAVINSYTKYIVEMIDEAHSVYIANDNEDEIIVAERDGNMVKVKIFKASLDIEMCKYGYDQESGTIKICCLCCFMIDYCISFA